MANTLSVTDLVLKEAQRIAHEKLQFIGTTDMQYDKSFRYDASRGPNGQSIRVREPNQYVRRKGSRVMDVQDQDERTQTFTVATQDGVDMRFNSAELQQSVNNGAAFDDLSKTYIEPALSVLCSGIEGDFIAFCTDATANLVGTPGTPMTDLTEGGEARAKLNQNLAPKDGNRYISADSVTMAGVVQGLSGLFQDSAQIKEQYREGMVGRTAMADWYENDRMATHTNSSDVTGIAINQASFTNGLTTLTIDGASVAPAVGSVFTLASRFAVHPETKASFSHLQQFVVTADTTPTTTAISFSPAIFFSTSDVSAGRQNVDSSPANNDALVWVGAASTGYLQNLMYHKEAYQFATVDLPIFDDAQKCVTQVKDNLSMRCWLGSDIRNDELLLRIDILYGFAALRPTWGCRITN